MNAFKLITPIVITSPSPSSSPDWSRWGGSAYGWVDKVERTPASEWGIWESLRRQLTASPAAVSWADGRIDVFGRGSDSALWHRSYSSGAWSSWESLGGQLAATIGPVVTH